MTLPDFFIIGAAKSGTTALFRYLKQHPQLYFSPRKEPHYFSFDEQSKLTKGPGDLIPFAVTDFQEYQSLFDKAQDSSLVGEASTSYLYRPEAPRRIYSMLPDSKMIAILRNPVERAFSAYMHLVRDFRETEPDFKLALANEQDRIEQNWDPIWHYTKVGMYGEQLTRYLSLFRQEQMYILLYEDFLSEPRKCLQGICQFLKVNPEFSVDPSIRMNVSGSPRNRVVSKIIKHVFDSPNPLRWFSRRLIPETTRWRLTEKLRQFNLAQRTLSSEDRRMLVEVFREDILLTQELISKDLSHWLVT